MSASPSIYPTPTTTASRPASFMNTLQVGHLYEDVVEYIFNWNSRYSTVNRPGGNFSEYDIFFSRKVIDADGNTIQKNLTIEVKADLLALNTGNMCVEYKTNFNPATGINATRATRWIHILHNYNSDNTILQYIDIPTIKLREYIRYNKVKAITGGNGKNSHFYLIPLSELEAYKKSISYDVLPEELVARMRTIPRFVVSV